ncbi:acyltransferase family protein [Curtobacterium flaccumfaciens]|uniref:acyltransferase family protein n=1 Tax=Curtobacterium flaccumfaciens TaxID=2035 RepID=UPI003D9A1C48
MPTPGDPRRLQGLDALRGLAILLVLLRHSWPDVFGNAGVVGVVVFFALSGYLITGLLVRDLRDYGRVRYRRFYRNRALRLLPALFLMLTGLVVVTLVWDPLDQRSGLVRAVVVGITYTANLPFDHGSSAVDHLWTLATEEQFYVVWPLVLALAVKFARVKTALTVSAALIVLALLATMALSSDVAGIYALPTSWCLAMVIGAAAFFVREQLSAHFSPFIRLGHLSASGALVLLGVVSLLPEDKGAPALYLLGGPAVAAATVVLVLYTGAWTRLPTRALSPIRALGVVSYAAYLWNWPIALWIGSMELGSVQPALVLALTLLAATASWWLVERPAMTWKSRLDRQR